MENNRNWLKMKPGQRVFVIFEECRTEVELVSPVHRGYPDGPWWVIFDDGLASAFTPDEIEIA